MYGYSNSNGKLSIIPEEAEMVRFIFRDYAAGKATPQLEKMLWNQGYPKF